MSELTKEYFDKQLKHFGKRFDGIDEKFESIDKRFSGIDKRFDGIDERFSGIDRELKSLRLGQEEIKQDHKGFVQHFNQSQVAQSEELKDHMSDVATSITDAVSEIVIEKEIDPLKKRVASLESKSAC